MGRGASESIWRIKGQDHKPTSTCSSKEGRKIPSRYRYIRTCYKGSVVLRTRRKMKAHCVFIQNNATSRKELQNLWQRIVGNHGSFKKIEIIFIGHYREIQSLNRLQKSQVL